MEIQQILQSSRVGISKAIGVAVDIVGSEVLLARRRGHIADSLRTRQEASPTKTQSLFH